jgi:O-antigen ligase
MTPRTSTRRRRSSSREGARQAVQYPGGLAIFFTTVLLAAILLTGPLILGAARLWIELPLLVATAFLLLVQGVRLVQNPPPGDFRRADAIDWTVGAFVLYTIIRWLTSPTEYFSRIEAMEVIGYAIIFLTCRYGMLNRSYGLWLLYLLVLLGVFETGFGYYLSQHLDLMPFGPTETLHLHYAPRWIGTYGCPNHYGALLVMAIGAALAMGSLSKLPWPVRIVLFYFAIMMMVGVVNGASRGSWIGLIFSLIALVIYGIRNGTMRWWIPVTGAAVLAVTAFGLFSSSQVARNRWTELINIFTGNNLQTYIRVELARDALHIAHDHPYFGTGPGTFVFVHPRYQDSSFGFKAVLTHDDYLNCLDDYGVVGFGIAMLFVSLVTLKFFRPLDTDHRWQDRVIVATGFAAWIALLVHSWVDFNLHIPANAMMLFALTGLALGRIKQEDSVIRHWSTFSLLPLGSFAGWALIVGSLVYGVWVARSAASDIVYEQAFSRMETVAASESLTAAQEALSYDPGNAQALVFLGDIYRYKASRQDDMADRLKDGQNALNAYQVALKANPLDDTIEARRGMAFDIMRRFPEAYFCYSSTVTEQPYNGQFWYRLGNHYWGRGMWVKAEEAYLMSISCPHGGDESRQAEAEMRQLPQMDGIPVPAPGTNPLTTTSDNEAPSTIP